MDPITLMAAGSTVAAIGTILGGIGAKQEAELNAFNIETDRLLNRVSAMQQASARMEEYESATASNIAAFSAMGRDIGSDRSVEAFLNRQQEIATRDVERIARQSAFQDLQSNMQALAERKRGQNALYSSLFSAAGQAGQGVYQYKAVG